MNENPVAKEMMTAVKTAALGILAMTALSLAAMLTGSTLSAGNGDTYLLIEPPASIHSDAGQAQRALPFAPAGMAEEVEP